MTDVLGLNSGQIAAAQGALGDAEGRDRVYETYDLGTTKALRKRRNRESRFRIYGLAAILISLSFLVLLVVSTFLNATTARTQTEIGLDITYDESRLDPTGARHPGDLRLANAKPLITEALVEIFPEGSEREVRRKLSRLVSTGAPFEISRNVADNPELVGTSERVWLPANSAVDQYLKGKVDTDLDESLRILDDQTIAWVETLRANGNLRTPVNRRFFANADSREPELAGILGALIGSLLVLSVCFFISFPIGVATAVYLEEFAPKNRFTDFLEVNINNLAAVPSIVYGLLGLFMFLTVFDLPRSSPLVGGMVLALMALPIIIIASRASLKSVPQSVRDAALGLGASKVQSTFHHAVPLAMPGMLTGTIIAMARALGETAPLLLIGMVAFLTDKPSGFLDAATVLPVQIFLWFDSPERAFQERASAAIIVLLVVLVLMNLLAVVLRKKLERRW